MFAKFTHILDDQNMVFFLIPIEDVYRAYQHPNQSHSTIHVRDKAGNASIHIVLEDIDTIMYRLNHDPDA